MSSAMFFLGFVAKYTINERIVNAPNKVRPLVNDDILCNDCSISVCKAAFLCITEVDHRFFCLYSSKIPSSAKTPIVAPSKNDFARLGIITSGDVSNSTSALSTLARISSALKHDLSRATMHVLYINNNAHIANTITAILFNFNLFTNTLLYPY